MIVNEELLGVDLIYIKEDAEDLKQGEIVCVEAIHDDEGVKLDLLVRRKRELKLIWVKSEDFIVFKGGI